MARSRKTTSKKAELHNALFPMLEAMHEGFKDLTKKKPEAPLGKNKVAMVNRLLVQCQVILEGELSLPFLDQLDEALLPQNSDVVLLLSQYVAAMRQFRERYTGEEWDESSADWLVK